MAPWPCSHTTRSQEKLSRKDAELRLGLVLLEPGCICWLLEDKAQACLCHASPLPRAALSPGTSCSAIHMLLATRSRGGAGGGAANGRPLVTPQSCVPPAVYGSSSLWGPDLMPSTKNDFPGGCGRGSAVGAAGLNEGQEGGKVVWLQRQMESGPGRTASAFFNMPFPF